MSAAHGFLRTNTGGRTQRWRHCTAPVFIVFYPRSGRPGHFCVYRAASRVPEGSAPWTVDNRRVDGQRGTDGVHTLREAMTIAQRAMARLS